MRPTSSWETRDRYPGDGAMKTGHTGFRDRCRHCGQCLRARHENLLHSTGPGWAHCRQTAPTVYTPGQTAGSLVLGQTTGTSGWLVFQSATDNLTVQGDTVDFAVGKAGNGAVDMSADGSSLTVANRLVIGELSGGVGDVNLQAESPSSSRTEIGSSVGVSGLIHVQKVPVRAGKTRVPFSFLAFWSWHSGQRFHLIC
jgi:hypothetical protein